MADFYNRCTWIGPIFVTPLKPCNTETLIEMITLITLWHSHPFGKTLKPCSTETKKPCEK